VGTKKTLSQPPARGFWPEKSVRTAPLGLIVKTDMKARAERGGRWSVSSRATPV